MRSGAALPKAEASAVSGASEVSTATRQFLSASWATTSAYQLTGTPGGSDPDITIHSARCAASTTVRVSASRASASSVAPGSLSLVVVPSCSVTATLVRTDPRMGTVA
jgi:hypothetical protein